MTPLLLLLQNAVVSALEKGVSKIGEDYALSLLRAAIGTEDSLKRIERAVDKLVQQPWRTGLERLRIAIYLNPTNPREITHRASRARDALTELDRAWGMADPDLYAPIDLMRGLAAALIPGAEEEAVQHLRSYIMAVEPHFESLHFRARILDADAEGFRSQAEKFGDGPSHIFGGSLLSLGYPDDFIKRQRLLRRASEVESAASTLRAQAEVLQKTQSTIESMIEVLSMRETTT